jgi:hypothetical protein
MADDQNVNTGHRLADARRFALHHPGRVAATARVGTGVPGYQLRT